MDRSVWFADNGLSHRLTSPEFKNGFSRGAATDYMILSFEDKLNSSFSRAEITN